MTQAHSRWLRKQLQAEARKRPRCSVLLEKLRTAEPVVVENRYLVQLHCVSRDAPEWLGDPRTCWHIGVYPDDVVEPVPGSLADQLADQQAS